MAEKVQCPTCRNKRTIQCPCCSGKGWVEINPLPPRLGKAYTCIDCAGVGEIPCPRCSPYKETIHAGTIQFTKMRLGFERT